MISRPILVPCLFALTAIALSRASAQQVIVSEIMYHPSGDAPEYLEIQNTGSTPYDIALWEIRGGIRYTFPDFDAADPQRTFLRNKERILVSSVDPEVLREAYGIADDVRIYGPWEGDVAEDGSRLSGFLSNQGERLTIRDKNGSLYSSVRYSDGGDWSVAADGAGHSLHVINHYRVVDDFRNWRASVHAGGSPGAAEPEDTHPDIHLNEVWFDAEGKVAWVELVNRGSDPVTLDEMTVRTDADLTLVDAADLAMVRAPLSGMVPAGGYLSVDVSLEADDDTGLYLADANGNVLSSHRFSNARTAFSYQVYPAGSGEWYGNAESSRDAANEPVRNTAIVINEIMFDPMGGNHGEFVELHNKGAETMDLGGWELEGAVDYVFPAGTLIESGEQLVVVADLDWFQSVYGTDVRAVGDFDGVLSNAGDRLRLIDGDDNLADEVDYGVGGEWPTLADDKGASMELVHPDMDNNRASAWRDSDESAKSTLREYAISKEYSRSGTFQGGGIGQDQELHFHLVGDGYVILEDVDLHRPKSLFNPNSDNIIENVDQQSSSASSGDGWVAQGTHAESFVDGNQLHLISDGRGDNRANRVEIDIDTLGTSTDLELTFKARWMYGKSRLIAQTVDHGWSHEFLIDVPENIGTPGAPNTAFQADPLPQADDLTHHPVVPTSSDNVTITARIDSIAPLSTVEVRYVEDSRGGNAESLFNPWGRAAMNDEGIDGDAVAGDGIYSGQITTLKDDGAVVVFYVRAEDTNGAEVTLPKHGVASPALYVVDDDVRESDLRIQRIVMSAFHLDQFGGRPQAKFDFKYPYVSNHYKPCTIIIDESYVIYGCEARSAGSPWHEGERPNLALKGKFKTPKSNTFKGRVKSTWDQDPTVGDRSHNDRITRYWMYLLGHPASDNEFIHLMVNAGNMVVREDVEPPSGNEFMDRHWENGSQGQMYRIDDEWTFPDNFSSRPSRNAEWDYKQPNGDRGGRYHAEWMLRSREVEYDYEPIVSLFKMTTENDFTQAQAERLINTEQMAINMAVRGYIGDWDTFSINRGKNGFMYRNSEDGRWMFIHWDSDLAFQNTSERFLNGNGSAFRNWHQKPYVRRLYNYYLNEILEQFTNGKPRMDAWYEAEESSSEEYQVRVSKYETWHNGRRRNTQNEIGTENMNASFAVTTNGGNDMATEADRIALEGTAASEVYEVILKGYPEEYPKPELEWLSETEWRLSDIVLAEGDNALAIRALDRLGNELGSLFAPRKVDLTVTKTGSAAPVVDVDTNPGSLNVGVSELLTLDASDSFDPEGEALAFDWEGPAEASYAFTSRPENPGVADASFNQPGLYSFTLNVTDASGATTTVEREAAVYGAGGFSGFGSRLESYWSPERIVRDTPSLEPASYSFNDRDGHLTIRVTGEDGAKPLAQESPTFPWIRRALPGETDWSLHGKLRLESLQFGSFSTGVLAEMSTDGETVSYTVSLLEGDQLAALRVDAGGVHVLASAPWDEEGVTVRLRRAGEQLAFEYREDKGWHSLHEVSLAAGSMAGDGGLYAATDLPHTMRVSFDFAMLIDPGTVSSLQKDLRLTEIMYNPSGGQDLEYLELQNVGTLALDLSGAHFTDGIDYTFENVSLAAGKLLVIAKDPEAFIAAYGGNVTLAPGAFEGQLANGGETITLVDGDQRLILSMTYGDSGDWPRDADGRGSSIELINPSEPINSPTNWKASPEGGTPGVEGEEPQPQPGDADSDGIADAWETAFGLNPADASDAATDADDDGWSALEEYLANTDPRDAASVLVVNIEAVDAMQVSVQFEAAADRQYVIERTSNLALGGVWDAWVTIGAEANGRSVQEIDTRPDDGERFYRVRVQP